jgi:hypothetical protein
MGVGVDTERRARRVFLGLLVFLGALVLRAGYIQLVRGEEFAARARQMHFKQVAVPAPRGRIFDRHGRRLVASYHACSIAADPQEVEDAAAFATSVAFLIGEPNAGRELAGKIEGKRRAGKRFVYLRRRIDRDLAARLRASDLAGLDVREEPRREYPHGGAAAALLGAVGADEHGRITGLTGLEHRFDAFLRGTDGTRSVFRSGRRESLHLFPERAQLPQAGGDVFTTLDIVLQQIVEDALDGLQERHRPKCSSAVALDPRTGEILALASRPSLDPDAFPDVSAECLRVPAAQCSYEPGSTFKPLVCAWALTRGAVREDEVFDCGRGARFFGGRRLRDVRPHGHLPLEMILVKSSNIGIAQVGQALGIDEAFRYLHLLASRSPWGTRWRRPRSSSPSPTARWRTAATSFARGCCAARPRPCAASPSTPRRSASSDVPWCVWSRRAPAAARACAGCASPARRARARSTRRGRVGTSPPLSASPPPTIRGSWSSWWPTSRGPPAVSNPMAASSPPLSWGRSSATLSPSFTSQLRSPNPGSGNQTKNQDKERCVLRRSIGLACGSGRGTSRPQAGTRIRRAQHPVRPDREDERRSVRAGVDGRPPGRDGRVCPDGQRPSRRERRV